MSRVGKLPVNIEALQVNIESKNVSISNGKVTREYKVSNNVKIEQVENELKLSNVDKNKSTMELGMDRSNIKNIAMGLKENFKIILEVNGVGYKVTVNGKTLFLSLGLSHDIVYVLPETVSDSFAKPNLLTLESYDKVILGQVAAEIISYRKPEPYKGKGIKKQGQYILRKEGKKK